MLCACCACCASHKSVQNKRIFAQSLHTVQINQIFFVQNWVFVKLKNPCAETSATNPFSLGINISIGSLLPCLIMVRSSSFPHTWQVVRNPRYIGSAVATFSPPQYQGLSRTVGLITSAALPPLQKKSRKASQMIKHPWMNTRAIPLLRVGSPWFGPTCKTIWWTLSSMSTICT